MGYAKKQQGKIFSQYVVHLFLKQILPVFLLLLFSTQCAYNKSKSDHLLDITHYEYGSLEQAGIQNEIERLQKTVKNTQAVPDAVDVHIKLAYLYSHYKNPNPDYSRALEHLDKYASLDTRGKEHAYFQNWLRMLKEISKAGSANEDLRGKLELLKKEVARIEKENTEMKEKLKQLKHLDIELEEKRKLVK